MKQEDLDRLRELANIKIRVGTTPMEISPRRLLELLDYIDELRMQGILRESDEN